MLQNMMNSLIEHEAIKTTVPKAKELRRVIEPMITLAKVDTVANRRLAFDRLRDRDSVTKLFNVLGPRNAQRPGGYTRRRFKSFSRNHHEKKPTSVFMVVCLALLPVRGHAHALGRGALGQQQAPQLGHGAVLARRPDISVVVLGKLQRLHGVGQRFDPGTVQLGRALPLAAVGRVAQLHAHHGAAAGGQLGQAPLDGGHGGLVAEQPMPWQVGRDHQAAARPGQAHPLAQGRGQRPFGGGACIVQCEIHDEVLARSVVAQRRVVAQGGALVLHEG
ncbi:hypothetical protein COLO4_01671 [Corchorus olitorius]|uniref:Ribosomal protein L17 n=1 Tax=Corchorus olitorius TaxID=93759 RepID=A0A1R3L2C4_9ROSI|nr:hypothetical protein COLO4_01671 [Corchorus olitorius]